MLTNVLPFGSAISCAHFQKFSNAIAHIVKFLTNMNNLNYLDDFFFVALMKLLCNNQIKTFLEVCSKINFPVSMEKTFWGTNIIVFLGLMIDTARQIVCIPLEKIEKILMKIDTALARKNKNITQRNLQKLCGHLNFVCKCIVPGRAFTRRLYSRIYLVEKPHHHIDINREMRLDLLTWREFLTNGSTVFNRPFFHFDKNVSSVELDFYTDASKLHGCGGVCGQSWFIMDWNSKFMSTRDPSINYLELFALTIGVVLWIEQFPNRPVTIFCDNMSVIHMVNNTSSRCPHCMILIRIIVLHCLKFNVKLSAEHVLGVRNQFADLLSRHKYKQFWQLARARNRKFAHKPDCIPEQLSCLERLW